MAMQSSGYSESTAQPADDSSCWQAVANLLRSLHREHDEEAIARTFLTLLPSVLPVSFCAISLYRRSQGGYWWAAGLCGGRSLSARLLDKIAGLCQKGLAREVLSLAPPLMEAYQGLVIDPERLALSELNPGPILAVSIKTVRADFGILLLGKGFGQDYSPEEHLRVCLLTTQLAQVIENVSLYSDTRHHDREIALIYQTGQRVTQFLDLSELMRQLVVAVHETFGYESVTLLLVDELANELVVKQTYGLRRERHIGFRIPITDAPAGGICGWVAYHGKPFLATNVRKEKRYLKTVEETRSELDVPLAIDGRVIGVLDVQSTLVGGVTEKDRFILETLADQVAIALENARLYEDLAHAHNEVHQTAKQLQLLLERTMRIQEQERRRIAADMHDDVSQLLYAALYEAEAGMQSLRPDLDGVRENLGNIQNSLNRAISEMRQAIFDLWPTSLDEMGLLPSVQSLLARFEKSSGIACTFRMEGQAVELTPSSRITIYRILQESLHNVQQHAKATRVEVSISFEQRRLLVSVLDNGIGFNPAALPEGNDWHLGLTSMRERARSIGGQMRIQSEPGKETLLAFEFPRECVAGVPDGREGSQGFVDPAVGRATTSSWASQ